MSNLTKKIYNSYYSFARERTPYYGDSNDTIASWRWKFFIQVIMFLAPLSVIVYIPGHLAAMRDGYFYIMIFDTITVLGIQALLFIKAIPLKWKKIILITLFFLLGMILLMGLGFGGPGFLYLVAVSVIAAMVYHTAAGYITMAINAIIIFIVFFLDLPHILNIETEPSAHITALLTYVINYLVLNTILVMAVSSLIGTLSKKLNEEKVLSAELKEKNDKYAEAVISAETSDRLKSEFLANMSHEIRTPLNAIIGFSDLISNAEEPEEFISYSKTIKNSALRLLHVITDIVEASKLSTNQAKIVKTDFDLKAFFDELNPVLQDLIIQQNKKDVYLFFKHPDYIPERINADKEKLERIIVHLTDNAIKFTNIGMVKISYSYNERQRMIVFEIKDTGTGISEVDLPNIYKPFYQKDDKYKEGNGLGLSICKGYVELWGGNISVSSTSEGGTTFTFTLPI